MHIKIRKSVFETNSSSMHSICIEGGVERYTHFPTGNIVAVFGDYGWGYDKLDTIPEKLSYILSSMQYYDSNVHNVETLQNSRYFVWLVQMVKGYTGGGIQIISSDDREIGSIDHQSTDMLDEYWVDQEDAFKENMKELLFNGSLSIIIDNDNH